MGVSLHQSDKSLRYQNSPGFTQKKWEIRRGSNYMSVKHSRELHQARKYWDWNWSFAEATSSLAELSVSTSSPRKQTFKVRHQVLFHLITGFLLLLTFLFSWNYVSIRWFGPAPPRTHTESFIRERKTMAVWKYPKTHTPSSNSNSNLSYFFLPNLLLEINLPSNKTLVFFSSSYLINVAWHETKIRILEKPDFSFA